MKTLWINQKMVDIGHGVCRDDKGRLWVRNGDPVPVGMAFDDVEAYNNDRYGEKWRLVRPERLQ